MKRLVFAIYGTPAGVVERDGGRLTLSYLPEYIAEQNPTPLSVSIPVSTATYPTRPVEAYLKGLLPDHASVRERWARKAGVKAGDTFGLVAKIGLDCAGGAIFAPEDQIADALSGPGTIEPASTDEIADRLRRLRQDDAAWQDDEDEEHWSLAGGQGKFTLARAGDGWGFARGTAPSTHIVKPGIGRIRAQALSEHISMRACALAGLLTATTHYLVFEDQPAIVVERFDRVSASDGSTTRLHQEDMCQAFGLDASRKYESDRGPGAQRITDMLRSITTDDSVERFVRAVIANQLLGAPDAHAKNYAALHIGRASSLAPLYDVATGLVPDTTGRLRYRKGAMSIGGERGFGDVEARHWAKLADACGVRPAFVTDTVAELAEQLPSTFEQAAREVDAPDAQFVARAVALNVRAVCEQALVGLASTRRTNGRLVTPFMDELSPSDATHRRQVPGQPRVPAGARTGAQVDVVLTEQAGDDPWEGAR